MDITQDNIQRLIDEAVEEITPQGILDMANKYIDFEAIQKLEQPISSLELATSWAVAGFVAGIRFTLENIDLKEVSDETAE